MLNRKSHNSNELLKIIHDSIYDHCLRNRVKNVPVTKEKQIRLSGKTFNSECEMIRWLTSKLRVPKSNENVPYLGFTSSFDNITDEMRERAWKRGCVI